ncbi:exported hypothetical protein [Mesorhizobium plurifarium]|uniref:Uncharacterized protein n=1 Tax=Mesorhizobium plurifarium TaxID=69974 RepID=A0A090DFA1_MESPL|nr:exported hypothetical protein [Mesorhizobium plurifarium]
MFCAIVYSVLVMGRGTAHAESLVQGGEAKGSLPQYEASAIDIPASRRWECGRNEIRCGYPLRPYLERVARQPQCQYPGDQWAIWEIAQQEGE